MLALPLAVALRAQAQQSAPYRVAWVSMDEAASHSPLLTAFRGGMADLGYVEGKNLAIDTWWGAGSSEKIERMSGEIVRADTDVIVTQGGATLPPILRAGITRPIVFSMSADPVEAKFVKSYAHPGGNVTGITLFTAELVGKRMALLREALPSIKRLAVIANPEPPGASKELQKAREAAIKLGLSMQYFPTSSEAMLDSALAEIARSRIEAALVFTDGFALGYADRISAFAIHNHIAVVSGWADFARRGNLMTYGPVLTDVYRRLATYVDRIHKGARPGDLPIEQPTKIELVVNLATARALGVSLPQSVLLSANEVIQ